VKDTLLTAQPDSSGQVDFRFLAHLAKLGATDLHPLGRAASDALIARLDLHPGQRVLDVGCGTGETMVRVARYDPAKLDGVDALPEMLRVARLRLRLTGLRARTALYRVTPGERLPFPDATYDRAYTESVLGIQDEAGAAALLGEVFRVLKPGGRYVANEAIWRAGVPAERIARINAACLADFGLRLASAAHWSLADWLSVMRDAGFRVVSDELLEQEVIKASASRRIEGVRALVSAAITRWLWLRGYLNPVRRRARARYRRLLEQHRTDGEYIEARLFVLEKPSTRAAPVQIGQNRPAHVL